MNKIYNFSSGPSMLPMEVLRSARKELYNWHESGSSVMEISHRSKEFIKVAEQAKQDLRDLLNIPLNYKVFFCHGGARSQFSYVPLNLLSEKNHADYINSGYWSYNAIKEAQKYCVPNIINVKYINKDGLSIIAPMNTWKMNENAAYIHYCKNETIEGISIEEPHKLNNQILIGDYSSTILSGPIDVGKINVIYASAQKNIGISGFTLVILDENLLGKSCSEVPSIFDYTVFKKYDSMYNTPTTFAWYISGLVLNWLKKNGGLVEIKKRNKKKSDLLYYTIDNSHLYSNYIASYHRSLMNITFHLNNSHLEKLFLKESEEIGLLSMKGHSIVGGIRVSIYNSMPLEGIKKLTDFMVDFECRYN